MWSVLCLKEAPKGSVNAKDDKRCMKIDFCVYPILIYVSSAGIESFSNLM